MDSKRKHNIYSQNQIGYAKEDHLGTRVDLVSWRLPFGYATRSLKPQIQAIMEQEAIHIA
ncbi:MAG: hypothetical protein ACRC8K_17920 [Waterburya sp.]